MPIISAIVSAATAIGSAIAGFAGTVSAAFTAGGFLASGTVAGFVARAALSIGLSMGLNAFAGQSNRKRGAQAEPAANNQTLQIGGNIPRQVAFGRVGTKGQLSHVWAHGAGNAYLTQIFVLSDGRIGGLTGIWLGDKKLTLRSLTPTHNEHQRFDTVEHDSPNFEIRVFDGRDGQLGAHSYLISVGSEGAPGETSAFYEPDRGAGVAYVVVTIWQFNNRWSGIPDWTFEIDGYRCYDPRFDSTAGGSGPMRWEDRDTWTTSSNPAVQVYNYLRGIIAEGEVMMGMDVPVFDLQHDLFMQAASICDETVTLLEGGTEARYVSSLIVTADEGEHRNAIAPIVQAMAGYLVEKVGQFGVIAGAAQVPVVSITDQDLVWTRGARYSGKLSRQSRANEVHGQFVDTTAAWQPNSYAPVKDAGAAANDGERLAQQLDLPAVPSPTQAFRIAKARLRESRRQSSADVEVGYHLLWLEIGDWISWTSEKYGFTKTFRIVGWGRNADDTTALSLREVGNEIYSHTAADEEPYEAPGTGTTDGPLLSIPQNWAVQADVAPDTSRPIVICSWTPITDTRVIAMIIEYRPVGTFDATRVRDDSPLDGRYVIDQPATGTEYEYRAQLRTEPPRPVFWTAWVRLTIADDVRDDIKDLREDIQAIADIGEQTLKEGAELIAAQVALLKAEVDELSEALATVEGTSFLARDYAKAAHDQGFAALSTEKELRLAGDENEAAQRTVLASRLLDAEGNILGTAGALQSLTTRVGATENGLVSQSQAITTLNSSLNSLGGTVAGVSSAVTNLQTSVTQQGNTVTSLSNQMTALQATVNDANGQIAVQANAVNNLTTRVTQTESGTTALAQRVDVVQTQLAGVGTASLTQLQQSFSSTAGTQEVMWGIAVAFDGQAAGGIRIAGLRRPGHPGVVQVGIRGNLLVDGDITGDKISFNAITRGKVVIGELNQFVSFDQAPFATLFNSGQAFSVASFYVPEACTVDIIFTATVNWQNSPTNIIFGSLDINGVSLGSYGVLGYTAFWTISKSISVGPGSHFVTMNWSCSANGGAIVTYQRCNVRITYR